MSAKKPRGDGDGRASSPLFITKREIVRHIPGVDSTTIDAWVAKGTFPPPHSRPGERTAVWLRRHFDFYVARGYWPDEAFLVAK
jgi:predicted DNA-binding transcriptional regulator AlpA